MKPSKSGAALAATAAVLLLSGSVAAQTPATGTQSAKVNCYGVNACQGKGACKTATNDCAGKNACAGKGFVEMTAAECKAKGGTVKQS